MKLGVFDHMDDAGVEPGDQFAQRLRLLADLDRLGYHAYHVAEHHGTPLGRVTSPAIWLAAAAQHTTRLRLGPLVFVLNLHEPLRLAEEICLLDHLSGGRLELGVGKGSSAAEAALFGLEPDRDRFEEAFEVMIKALTEPALDHRGALFEYRDVPVSLGPRQKPHPPLWYGTNSPGTMPWAASHRINVLTLAPAATAAEMTERYREAWEGLERPEHELPLLGAIRHVVLAEDEAEARRIADRAYARWRTSLRHWWVRLGVTDPPTDRFWPATFDELTAKGMGLAGTPEQARDFFARDAAEGGINYLCLQLAFGDISLDEARRTAELTATEVLPTLVELGAAT